MTHDPKNQQPNDTHSGNIAVVEVDVEIKTPDGVCDAAFFYTNTSCPAVLVWSDAFGLRPALRALAAAACVGG